MSAHKRHNCEEEIETLLAAELQERVYPIIYLNEAAKEVINERFT